MESEGAEALLQADAMIQMNQTGYIDGYMKANNIRYTAKGRGAGHRERKLWERIKGDWKEAFDRRFKKGVIKEMNKMEQKSEINK